MDKLLLPSSGQPSCMVFASHPVQYYAPIYRHWHSLAPGRMCVVYGTDCSAKGYVDKRFGQEITWDVPLLEGYPNISLNTGKGKPLSNWASVGGRGVRELLLQYRPDSILLTQFSYEYSCTVYSLALALGIPIWLRQETQDEAFKDARVGVKAAARSLVYDLLYAPTAGAFYFGSLNRRHLMAHGIPASRLHRTMFGTPDALAGVSDAIKASKRETLRRSLKVGDSDHVICFSGKFYAQKDPYVLLNAIDGLPPSLRNRVFLLMVGSGEMKDELAARVARMGIRHHFTGFVNQTKLVDCYLAADTLVLPSKGEVWGLVVNEALQSGCSVVISDRVGCAPDFGHLERVRVFPRGDSAKLTEALIDLMNYSRDFNWARPHLDDFSMESAGRMLASVLTP